MGVPPSPQAPLAGPFPPHRPVDDLINEIRKLRKAVEITATPNKGGKPQQRVEFEGQTTTRVRRGKVVEIPPDWRGSVTRKQTIRKRNTVSRRTRKENK